MNEPITEAKKKKSFFIVTMKYYCSFEWIEMGFTLKSVHIRMTKAIFCTCLVFAVIEFYRPDNFAAIFHRCKWILVLFFRTPFAANVCCILFWFFSFFFTNCERRNRKNHWYEMVPFCEKHIVVKNDLNKNVALREYRLQMRCKKKKKKEKNFLSGKCSIVTNPDVVSSCSLCFGR